MNHKIKIEKIKSSKIPKRKTELINGNLMIEIVEKIFSLISQYYLLDEEVRYIFQILYKTTEQLCEDKQSRRLDEVSSIILDKIIKGNKGTEKDYIG